MKVTFDFRHRADTLDVAEMFALAGHPHKVVDELRVVCEDIDRPIPLISTAIVFAPVQITVE